MKSKYLLIAALFIGFKFFSQESKRILFAIDGEPYYTSEFLDVYKKNQEVVVDTKSSIEDYLKLFIDYKLKVKEAKLLGLDTLQKYRNELKEYKNKLIVPYLRDDEVTKKLVKEAYARLKKEIDVSHILIFLNQNATPQDTLKAYNKLIEARNLILAGNDFGEIAKKYSNDPTVKRNEGRIGYFTVLQMVYPFENVAYTTPINNISMPFRTKFGYHILKVNAIRESKGEVEVAHIMFKKESASSKKKIDSIYELLQDKDVNFYNLAKQVSEDRATAIRGGKLKKFGSGKMIENFANVAFSLEEEGAISKPFQTQYGWHIVKLIKKYPIDSFDKIKDKLEREVKKDVRSNLVSKSVINKLLKQYKIVVNEEALKQFELENWKRTPESFNKNLLSINGQNSSQKKFITYLKTVVNTSSKNAFESFKEKEVLNYYKNNIEYSNAEFAKTYKEFKEGLLLFDLLEKKVWEKSKDSSELLSYFNKHKAQKYQKKSFKKIQGSVISDYQSYLEQELVKQLHHKYEVKVNKSEKKRIKKLNL